MMEPPDSRRNASRSSTESWARVRALVEKTLTIPEAERPAYLDVACGDDDALRQRVERLTVAYERADESWGFLAHPASEFLTGADNVIARLNSALADVYSIEREIGTGGMATVYLAHDVKHERQVAIKVLHPELSAVLGAERFLSEIKTTAALQHPQILPLFDSGTADGLLYYVMPLVEGETLRTRLTRERQLSVAEAVRIAREVAGALDYAHRRGVIHRDIKPENILLHEGRPVVADFGIALAVSNAGTERITRPGLSLGTPQYMSPEQTTGEQTISARSDVYSLGAVTYEMLTGEAPFTGATVQQIVTRARTEEPRPIRAQRKHVPPNVEAAVLVALEKLPADRLETAADFARALGDADFRGVAGFDGGDRATRTTWNQERILISSLAACAVLLGAAAMWGWLRTPATVPDVVRFEMQLPPDLSAVSTAATGDLAISPSGRVIVFSASAPDGARRLYARTLDEIAPRALAGTEGASDPFFSPDGRWIGFWSRGQLRKVAAEGGLPQTLAAAAAGQGATWTNRDVIVFAAPGGLYVIPSTGGAAKLLSSPDPAVGEIGQMYPVALPDGDHVLYSSLGRTGPSIGIASLSSRSAKLLGIVGTNALGVIDGLAIYATRDNVLMAVALDASAGHTSGASVPIVTQVAVGVVGSAKAALSLSGSLAYRAAGRGSRMVVTDGKRAAELVLPESRAYAFPRFSPDGNRVAVSIDAGTRSDIWLYDLDSRASTRLSAEGSANERPEWTPDGTRVLYRTGDGSASSLWWRAADLSGPAVPLLAGSERSVYEGVITPDGRSIVYQVDNDIESKPLTGGAAPRVIARSNNLENQARVSPDGRWVAFVTDESGSDEVVVQPLTGPGIRAQVSRNGGVEPVWSRDGRQLFYRGSKKFVAANVTTSPTFSVLSREVLFDDSFVPASAPHANYDVSPDGKHFLVLAAVENPQILIVHNWAAEVRARFARRGPR
jgi:eukaryotic-like serine/threonine-protein kinase